MILTVHGYNTDPYSDDPDDKPTAQQAEFAKALYPYSTKPFNWFSAVQGKHWFRALLACHLNTYAWAYQKLSLRAAADFLQEVRLIEKRSGQPVAVFAHSLGSRVVLEAVRKAPWLFDKICLINAAERVSVARPILLGLPRSVKLLNVCVRDDDILDKAAGFMSPGIGKEPILGQVGLREDDTYLLRDRYTQIFLDDPMTQKVMKNKYDFDLRGDNPRDYGDHHYSYRWSGNWDLYSSFFSGDLERKAA